MSRYFFDRANNIAVQKIKHDKRTVYRKIIFAVPEEKWEEFKNSELSQKLYAYIQSQSTQGEFHNLIQGELTKETAESENVKAKDIFNANTNPQIKDIVVDERGEVLKLRDAEEPATLEMIQYYYHLGNLYKDKIDTKANIALALAAISAFVSAASVVLNLL